MASERCYNVRRRLEIRAARYGYHMGAAERIERIARELAAAAEGLITLEELRSKLAGLEEIRHTVERELEVLKGRREKVKALEQDRDVILETYAQMTPEALDSLTPEERQQFYKMLRLRVVVRPDGWARISGAFDSGDERMYFRNNLTMLWPPHTGGWAGVLQTDSWAR